MFVIKGSWIEAPRRANFLNNIFSLDKLFRDCYVIFRLLIGDGAVLGTNLHAVSKAASNVWHFIFPKTTKKSNYSIANRAILYTMLILTWRKHIYFSIISCYKNVTDYSRRWSNIIPWLTYNAYPCWTWFRWIIINLN